MTFQELALFVISSTEAPNLFDSVNQHILGTETVTFYCI